jgi:tRNA modification GTPase
MVNRENSDTIYALSSGAGRAGVAVIRISGAGAGTAIGRLAGNPVEPGRIVFRQLLAPADRSLIDEAMVWWMAGPGTFTGEDVAELQVHGSRAVVDRVLGELGQLEGFRPAEAGEFSARAFRNGKMDLVAVEGLADLIASETEQQRRQAVFQQSGGASQVYEIIGERLKRLLAYVEASIDFVDEDGVEDAAFARALDDLAILQAELKTVLSDRRRGERLRHGVVVVIAGAPNVGKSSLLNALAGRDAAIVSPIEGTTRDAIEVFIDLGWVPVVFVDTAGLRARTDDAIEAVGMERTRMHLV